MVKMRDLPDGSDARALANRADDLIAEPESAQPQPPDEAQSARPSPPDEAHSAPPTAEPEDRSGHPARLIFASFLMLFVELALIRWVTANNVYVTKATNFVLLASFLGIGIGFLNARGGGDYLRWTLVVLLLPRVRWWQIGAVAIIITLLLLESVVPQHRWSPYNKLSYIQTTGKYPALNVSANNIPYQAARGLPALHAQKPFYFYPYRHVTRASLNNVLIIGSGTGNDAAVALSEGAKHVDAVEIDPVLPKIGRVHPDHPYQNPRLTLHIADGREYLQNTNKKYNLIVFALPDSLSALAGQGGLRLESYLLTEQSLAAARTRLAPGGTFAMYNYYAPFLFNRYATTLQDVYHRAPCAEVGPPLGGRRLSVLTIRPAGPVPNCATNWHGTAVAPATDDHPFPYLPTATLPGSYLLMLGLILAGAALLVRLGGGRFRSMRSYLDLGFMGAAFMLLETKSIVQFALLFGATWFVNALVFAGVLVAVYLAVETARWVRLPRPAVLYAALIAALAVAWLVPQASLLDLPLVPRFLAASALAFAPVYLANLVFAQRFSDVETSNTAFAANLLGAMVGGTLEYIALITGYHFLLIVIGVLYGFAFVIGRRLQRA